MQATCLLHDSTHSGPPPPPLLLAVVESHERKEEDGGRGKHAVRAKRSEGREVGGLGLGEAGAQDEEDGGQVEGGDDCKGGREGEEGEGGSCL